MRATIHALAALAALGLAGCAAAARSEPPIGDAESLVRAMHGRYADSWYRTLSFTQATTRVLAGDSTHTEEWREWAALPGRLRIEMGAPAEGRVVIFANDSTYVLQHGRVVRRNDRMNPLMTVGFDVYRQPPERTLDQLRRQGFDLSRFHLDTLEGTPVYVVGAERGDTAGKQFAVEAERLLFVRLLEPVPGQPGVMQHVWFRRYEPLAGGWIAPEVEVLVGGRRVFHEVYSNLRANDTLDPELFAIPAGG
ncbi:MAG: hypothetical protein KY467_18585 [Gemmatimonadetes bacterium]|nr:hypothetical protein [Gemmatimonadota bacterium]